MLSLTKICAERHVTKPNDINWVRAFLTEYADQPETALYWINYYYPIPDSSVFAVADANASTTSVRVHDQTVRVQDQRDSTYNVLSLSPDQVAFLLRVVAVLIILLIGFW
jgi:hypothetical protein